MYDWHFVLGIVSGLLAMLAVLPYIKDILHGTTRPNIVSWLLWVLLLLISTLAQFSAGASWSLIFLIGDLIGTSIIFILCIAGYGYGKYSWLEVVCFVMVIISVVAWQITNQPILAIIFAAVADLMAAIPTIVKSYRDPWSEDPPQFLIIAFASLLGILSTRIFDASNLVFPAYLLFVNVLIGSLAYFGRRFRQKSV